MAVNSPKLAGRDAVSRHGWAYAHRFLLARRAVQLLVLAMFLAGPWWGVWILKGNYSSSLLLDTVPLTDPLILLQSLAAGYWPQTLALVGGLIIAVSYALIASRAFCAWVCPLNMVTDAAAWLRRKLGIRTSATLPRMTRYVLLAMILIGSAFSGTLLWEWVNPVATLGRALIFGAGAGLLLVIAIFVFDLLVVEHGWCGHLCPMGALYGVIGAKGLLRVNAVARENCTRCMDCYHVCPEPHVLRTPLHGNAEQSTQVLSQDCITCGRCIDVCAEHVFQITTRLTDSGVKK